MKRREPEREIQTAIVKALREHCKHPWWAVPNGGARHIRVAAKLKAEGVRPGVADLCFILPGPMPAFLEFKSENGKLSKHQKAFLDEVAGMGCQWGIAHSIDEAHGILAAWGCLPSEVRR